MAIVEMELDPNAASYTDDEIVGKVNTATANITRASSVAAAARPIAAGEVGATELAASAVTNVKVAAAAAIDADKLASGTTNKVFTATEQTKLTGVEESATADQTGAEMQTAILGLSDADRKLIKTDPQTGEFTVLSIQRKSTGKLGAKYENVAV